MKVVICDDKQYMLDEVYKIVSGWMNSNDIDGEIKSFDDPEEALKFKDWTDIMLLDVEMPDMDGFTVAKQIRRSGYDFPVAFLTSHKDRIQEAFKVKAFRYLYKPINEVELKECLDDMRKELSNKVIIIGDKTVNIKDIEYIEALGEGCAIYTLDDHIVTKATLKDISEELGDSFYRCHKSYIINFIKVVVFNKNSIELKSGTKIPLATRKTAEVKKAYKAYVIKHAKII